MISSNTIFPFAGIHSSIILLFYEHWGTSRHQISCAEVEDWKNYRKRKTEGSFLLQGLVT